MPLILADYSYAHPFVQPLPIWNYWPFLLIPLAAAISIVYKSIKCQSMSQVPKQAFEIFLWIIGGIVFAAFVLAMILRIIEKL